MENKELDIDTMSFRINDQTSPSISSNDARGPVVCFADGTVFRISPSTPERIVRALITINGGEKISREQLVQEGFLIRCEE